ncbi:helix-turn-helix domain-containing protein [Mucilaginibacter paludis]|nr:helix-turn-helix domain-containing protein [Mucilaginibacter paludis]
MKTLTPQRLKELRLNLGYSQNDLADNAKLNLRTIQRIENGETVPRGDTMKRLYGALNITPEDLEDGLGEPDNSSLALLNLSALSFIVFPILGGIVPLILWTINKDKVKGLYDAGKQLLSFEITWCLFLLVTYAAALILKIEHIGFRLFGENSFDILFKLSLILYVYHVIVIVINAIKIRYQKPVNYFIAIRFLR